MSSDDFAKKHTFIPFLRAVYFDQNADGDSIDRPSFSNFIPALAFYLPNDFPRFCRRCLEEDLSWHGFSFWRTTHQLPVINKCHKHEFVLTQANVNPNHVLPSDLIKSNHKINLRQCNSDAGFPHADRFRSLAIDLLDLKNPIPLSELSERLTQLACDRGFSDIRFEPRATKSLRDFLEKSLSRRQQKPSARSPINWDGPRVSRRRRYPSTLMTYVVSGRSTETVAACLASLVLAPTLDAASSIFYSRQNNRVSSASLHGTGHRLEIVSD